MLKFKRCKTELLGRYIRNTVTNEIVTEKDNPTLYSDLRKKAIASEARQAKDQAMKDLGLSKCYGAVSGKAYWE